MQLLSRNDKILFPTNHDSTSLRKHESYRIIEFIEFDYSSRCPPPWRNTLKTRVFPRKWSRKFLSRLLWNAQQWRNAVCIHASIRNRVINANSRQLGSNLATVANCLRTKGFRKFPNKCSCMFGRKVNKEVKKEISWQIINIR